MSLLKALRAQLGLSGTATNNFTITAEAADGSMKLARGNAGATTQDVLTVTSGGVVKTPQNLVAVSAYNASAQTISTGAPRKVILPTEHFDTGNAFDSTTNYRFQPTVAGYYQINGAVVVAAVTTYSFVYILKNGVELKAGPELGNCYGGSVSGLVYLNGSTDYVELWAATGTTVDTIAGASYCWFDGHLLGAA